VRITLDSTIIVRANQRASGPARILLLEIRDRGHKLITSATVLDEVNRVLRYPRLLKCFALTESETTQFVSFIAASAEIVEVDETIITPIRDAKDVHVDQTAISGKSTYLCTLDGHFHTPQVVAFCAAWGVEVISDLDLLKLVRG